MNHMQICRQFHQLYFQKRNLCLNRYMFPRRKPHKWGVGSFRFIIYVIARYVMLCYIILYCIIVYHDIFHRAPARMVASLASRREAFSRRIFCAKPWRIIIIIIIIIIIVYTSRFCESLNPSFWQVPCGPSNFSP